ncbi:hypothetical protein A0O34_15115 [Chryseobacterium glaciei]|uniref:Uncharacterized protein n=1 Tax=Chryseobacterium glaciei TaxID=1685010 RepID=A0A172XXL5_9FLAO|nr:hypothetical protein [Chryseobacterium glaciei]ANF51753.1 hypothetical protein A0O34_15115 [Chryseobacterium glaciei]
MTKQEILDAIQDQITTNGLQEITGQILNMILTSIATIIPDDAMLTSSFGGIVTPASVIVVTPGQQKWVFANPGTYPNYGGFTFVANKINILSYDGAEWQRLEIDIDNLGLALTFDPSNNTEPISAKLVADRYDKIITALDSFFVKDKKRYYATDTSLGWSINALKNDNTKVSTGLLFLTALNIPTIGREKMYIKLVRFSTLEQYLDEYSSMLGVKANGDVEVLLIGKLNSLPKEFEEFTIDISSYTSISICYDLVNENTPDLYRPTIELYSTNNEKDSVKAYIDNKALEDQPDSVYSNKIKDVVINIDNLTGVNDDAKIDKAIAMVENVGGGQIYFPSRQINISKAILIPSNTRFILDNCQIQMINNIHDNIFRSKGLKINPAQPNGLQTEADWAENFEILGIGMPTMRQSIVPLHVGDAYGWRGCSILLVKSRNYKISNIKIIESHMWSISNEYCENGYFENLEFQNTLYANADGLNFRNGCKNMYAKKLRGVTNDNAVATTVLDSTIPVNPNAGYSYQALGWSYGDYHGAENIIVEDVQVKALYGVGLIISTSNIVKNITYKDFVSSVVSANDWDNVAVCGNSYRSFVYGTSYVDGNVHNINIINSTTSIHQYSLGIYGGKIEKIYTSIITNSNLSGLGAIKNDTTTVIN